MPYVDGAVVQVKTSRSQYLNTIRVPAVRVNDLSSGATEIAQNVDHWPPLPRERGETYHGISGRV